MKRIVYVTSDGELAVVFPNKNSKLTLEEIAEKDVPKGVPYKIVVSDEDDDFFNFAWEVDMSEPDGVGADYGFGSENSITKIFDDKLVTRDGKELKRLPELEKRLYTKPKVNIQKVRESLHDFRRAIREEEFSPLDLKISASIPGINIEEIEAEREKIRQKYHKMQDDIDAIRTAKQAKHLAMVMANDGQ